MLIKLDHRIWFPDPATAEENGLLAVGGDLSVRRLLLGYLNGIFPWYEDGEPILWWSPPERYLIRPSGIHVSHSMKKFMKRHDICMVIGREFADTMHRCRAKREGQTWITDEMEEAYYNLCEAGFATGVEVFFEGALAGGLYGVVIDRCFFGESMFTEISNGSKVALIMLARLLEQKGFRLIDCQFHTDHLQSMGGEYISRAEYRKELKEFAASLSEHKLAGLYKLDAEGRVISVKER